MLNSLYRSSWTYSPVYIRIILLLFKVPKNDIKNIYLKNKHSQRVYSTVKKRMHEDREHTQASSRGQLWTPFPLNCHSRWVQGFRESPQKYALLPLRCLAWHPWTHQEGSGSELDAPVSRKTIEELITDLKNKHYSTMCVCKLTLGPTSLSDVILEKSSAVCVRTWGCVQLQKRSSK